MKEAIHDGKLVAGMKVALAGLIIFGCFVISRRRRAENSSSGRSSLKLRELLKKRGATGFGIN